MINYRSVITKFLLSLAMLSISDLALAKVYQWVDKHGITHFSDKPKSGAKEVTVPDIQTFSTQKPASPTTVPLNKEQKKLQVTQYQSLNIVTPQNEQVVHSNSGIVPVEVAIEPELDENDSIELILDGKISAIITAKDKLKGTLQNVYRGEHYLTAQITSKNKKALLKSEPIKFHVFHASRLNPPRRS